MKRLMTYVNVERMNTCMVTQSLSWSLVGLGEPVDRGVTTCGGLWTTNRHLQCGFSIRKMTDCNLIILHFSFKTYKNRESKHTLWKTSKVWLSTEWNSLPCKWFLHSPKSPNKTNTKNSLHHYLSLLLSHSSCASRRILSSSPCRAEEMLSCGPVRLSLRLTAAISSSSSTQEPGEETIRAAEFVLMLGQSAGKQKQVGLHSEPDTPRDEESKQIYSSHWVTVTERVIFFFPGVIFYHYTLCWE